MKRLGALACAAAAVLWLQVGCSAADQTRTARDEPPEQEVVDVNTNVNLCPRFDGSLIVPQTIQPGQTAVVVVNASDPDGDSATLTYEWSATSGSIVESEGPGAKYSCGDAGPQILTVTTKDARGCHAKLEIHLSCLSD